MHTGTMRRRLLAAAGIAGAAIFSTTAMAADLSRPVYKAPPAGVLPAAYDWTGFYVGGHVGYGFGQKDWSDNLGLNSSADVNGVLGGGQVGFNYQVGQFVFGVEGDFTGTGIRGSSTTPLGATIDNKVDWTSTLTGRAGIAFDRWLVYGKGGVAWAGDKFSTNAYTPVSTEISDTRMGWTAGAGVEWAFAPQWSAKIEYDYLDFGSKNYSFAPGFSTDIDQQIHEVKIGVNYKFGGGGPIMARY